MPPLRETVLVHASVWYEGGEEQGGTESPLKKGPLDPMAERRQANT
jgi:hypothetical protein